MRGLLVESKFKISIFNQSGITQFLSFLADVHLQLFGGLELQPRQLWSLSYSSQLKIEVDIEVVSVSRMIHLRSRVEHLVISCADHAGNRWLMLKC